MNSILINMSHPELRQKWKLIKSVRCLTLKRIGDELTLINWSLIWVLILKNNINHSHYLPDKHSGCVSISTSISECTYVGSIIHINVSASKSVLVDVTIGGVHMHGLVWFLCLMTYQPSWFIKYQSHRCRRTAVVLFNPWLGNKWIHTFPKGNSRKVNVITWLEFELVYLEVGAKLFDLYATRTPSYMHGCIYPIICQLLHCTKGINYHGIMMAPDQSKV